MRGGGRSAGDGVDAVAGRAEASSRIVSQERIDGARFESDFVLTVSENRAAGLDEARGLGDAALAAVWGPGLFSWTWRIFGRYARVPASI